MIRRGIRTAKRKSGGTCSAHELKRSSDGSWYALVFSSTDGRRSE